MRLELISAQAFQANEYQAFAKQADAALCTVDNNEYHSDMLDWLDVDRCVPVRLCKQISSLADEIRGRAEVFVVVGVGGSNQGARAVIDALRHNRQERSPQIIYAGLNLSAEYYERIIRELDGRSVYINVIAKNFKTLEPGVGFRVLRQYMESRYSAQELSARIITTATLGDGELHELSLQQGYRFLPFPNLVGGRYSVFTAVGLLPIAVAGIDISALLDGARAAMESYRSNGSIAQDAKRYALTRNLLLSKNLDIEVMAFFEPALEAFGRWWRQLFGESEGKSLTGIFPAICSYTEDLHSMGQYIQQGKRQMMESFVWIEKPAYDMTVPPTAMNDGLEYLDGKTLDEVNRSAYQATVQAHSQGGVPCFQFILSELCPYTMGELMYFFLVACYYSAVILGVDPFDQPGVENYKKEMYKLLRESGK